MSEMSVGVQDMPAGRACRCRLKAQLPNLPRWPVADAALRFHDYYDTFPEKYETIYC